MNHETSNFEDFGDHFVVIRDSGPCSCGKRFLSFSLVVWLLTKTRFAAKTKMKIASTSNQNIVSPSKSGDRLEADELIEELTT